MDYEKIEQRGPDVVLVGLRNFVLEQVLDCGQCFRWRPLRPGEYSGIAYGRRLDLSFAGGDLTLRDVSLEEYGQVWQAYFDLGRDYGKLKEQYAADRTLNDAIAYSPGLRLMRQDPWETLISFILSQNSNIPRIKGMVERLCESFGEALYGGGFAFPKPEALAGLPAEALKPLRCGYRAGYILDAAQRVADGRLRLAEMQELPTCDICHMLMEIHGVGPKVAECALLYGFGRIECFPLDVWMKKVMADYYPQGFPEEYADTAGIAQQFLFHYIRTGGPHK